jgi:DNA polymerase III epsilon subunit-like protein
MSTSLTEFKNYAVLDTETTGLGKLDQVIEVTLIHSSGDILFNSLVKPTQPIHWAAQKIHKITNDELESAPYWKDIYHEFEKATSLVDVTYIYNENFDVRLINQTYNAYDIKKYDYNTSCAMKAVKSWLMDKGLLNGSKFNLTNVCEILKIEHNDVEKHRALGDCILTNRVIEHIISAENTSANERASFIKPAKFKSKVELSETLNKSQYIIDQIDKLLLEPIFFENWVDKLKHAGITVEPLHFNQENPEFTACSFIFNNSSFSSSNLGKNYTPRKLISRGLNYNMDKDRALLEKLHLAYHLSSQQAFIKDLVENNNSYANVLLKNNFLIKTIFTVLKKSKYNNTSIKAEYSSLVDNKNTYSQLKLDVKDPKGILLRKISVNNKIVIELDYAGKYDNTPCGVKLINENIESEYLGDKCVNKAVSTLSSDEIIALAAFFKGEMDSELSSVNQGFIDAVSGNEIISIKRFMGSHFTDKCCLVPSLVTENEARLNALADSGFSY